MSVAAKSTVPKRKQNPVRRQTLKPQNKINRRPKHGIIPSKSMLDIPTCKNQAKNMKAKSRDEIRKMQETETRVGKYKNANIEHTETPK